MARLRAKTLIRAEFSEPARGGVGARDSDKSFLGERCERGETVIRAEFSKAVRLESANGDKKLSLRGASLAESRRTLILRRARRSACFWYPRLIPRI